MYVVIALVVWLVLGLIGWAIAQHRHPNPPSWFVTIIPCVLLGAIPFIIAVFFGEKETS